MGRLRQKWSWRRSRHGAPNLLSTAGSFRAPVGERFEATSLAGYYIDFRSKVAGPHWPPPWLGADKRGKMFAAMAQWGLGAFEHFLATDDEQWLAAARGAADHLLGLHQRGGRQDGGWPHDFRYGHTFPLEPPWLSGMAQGEAASLLARIAQRTRRRCLCRGCHHGAQTDAPAQRRGRRARRARRGLLP